MRDNFHTVESNLHFIDQKIATVISLQYVRELFTQNSQEYNRLTDQISVVLSEIRHLIQLTKRLQVESDILLKENRPEFLEHFLNKRNGNQRNP